MSHLAQQRVEVYWALWVTLRPALPSYNDHHHHRDEGDPATTLNPKCSLSDNHYIQTLSQRPESAAGQKTLQIPKAPRVYVPNFLIALLLVPKYLYRDYFEAKVYTIGVHRSLGYNPLQGRLCGRWFLWQPGEVLPPLGPTSGTPEIG